MTGRELLTGDIVDSFPRFCLERWQSLHETRARVLLSESGGEPPSIEELKLYGVDVENTVKGIDLGYGWTRGWPPLREAISKHVYENLVGAENILVTSGGAEANMLTVLALIKPGDIVVVDTPNYMQVHGLLRARGARIYMVRRKAPKWELPLERLVDVIHVLRPRAVYVTNPNNPTGSVARCLDEVAAEAARSNTILVFDEVYRGLELDDRKTPSILEAALSYGADAVSTGSLSKTYSLPGLRIGWAAATSATIAEKLWAAKDYTTISPSRPSEAIATKALSNAAERLAERTRSIALRNLRALERVCRNSTIEVMRPTAGAFTLLRLPPGTDDMIVAEKLYNYYGILAVPASCMGAPGYLRVGLGIGNPGHAENNYRELCKALQTILRELQDEKGAAGE